MDNIARLKLRVQVEFTNHQGLQEAGIDGGGLFKDFLMELFKQAFDPERGFWKATAKNELFPNPDSASVSPYHLQHFEFQGRMLGKALYEGILIELNLAGFFLNLMQGHLNHLHDLQSLDPELYKNILQLKRIDDPSSLGLFFSIAKTRAGATEEVDLIPGGSDVPVNKDNYVYYIRRLSSYRLNEEFSAQAAAFFKGFTALVPRHWIRMFKAPELQLLIAGAEGGFEVGDMRRACTYGGGYHASQPYIELFWEIVEEFDQDERAKLLRFITSCSKPPLQGFATLNPPLCVYQVRDSSRLATASTCVNMLKLPKYGSREELKERLLYSIMAGAGFELS
jgi:ubiquitin-protein ligase E3 C